MAGACGIAAGTPLAVLGAIGQAAEKGAIIKGGLYLEVLSRIDTRVLDKTERSATAVWTCWKPGPFRLSAEKLLATAAIAESRSDIRSGKAIIRRRGS